MNDTASANESPGGAPQRRAAASPDEVRAEQVLAGTSLAPPEMLALAKRLAQAKHFGLARRLLRRCRLGGLKRDQHPKIYLEIFQKSALYTYKDPDLPLAWRLDQALEILREVEDLATTESQETLGLAGAIYKRKWEADGARRNLETSLFHYLRGYSLGVRVHEGASRPAGEKRVLPQAADVPAGLRDVIAYLRTHPGVELWAEKDRGYCGINAAFVLDLLAHEEEAEARRAGLTSGGALARREAARLIREEILRSVPPLLSAPESAWLAKEWWFYATVGEAHFGLGPSDPAHYEAAIQWLVDKPTAAKLLRPAGPNSGAADEIPEWEYESTARQLARLARIQHAPNLSEEEFARTAAGMALARFLGNDATKLRSAFRGRFGLALSGGGFRASLFHIGVLAHLAELDLLRHIEVLSCVSGGSIIGAYYYLEVRRLLQTKADDAITQQDYFDIVRNIEREFLAGVQRNIRTRVLAEWTTNLKMLFWPGYSRTIRVGELYERELFSRVKDGAKGARRGPRMLDELQIRPLDSTGKQRDDFRPLRDNWRREAKAPVLVLNATSLNTGHVWQFTTSFMGEPPAPLVVDIDGNYRLRRMYYEEAPESYRSFPLGSAVAASSCVPGLFEPLTLRDLYPDQAGLSDGGRRIDVRLVDGGVCDNQGVASLLEQDCTVLIVSDASGQMEAQDVPGDWAVPVLLRSTSVAQARIREAQYLDIEARKRSGLLRGLVFVHLRQGLVGRELAWKECPSSRRVSDSDRGIGGPEDATPFGVAAEVQRKLSAIRTDLDSFSDAEAYALMTSAYRMTVERFADKSANVIDGFVGQPKPQRWSFLSVADAMEVGSDAERRKRLERLLQVGSSQAFKIWQLSGPLRVTKWAGAFLALGALALVIAARWRLPIVPGAVLDRVTFEWVVLGVLAPLALAFVVKALIGRKNGETLMRIIHWRETAQRVALAAAMSLFGFLVARIHLHVFDRLFLRHGTLERVLGRRRQEGPLPAPQAGAATPEG